MPKDIWIPSVIKPRQNRIPFVPHPTSASIIAVKDAGTLLVVGVKDQQSLLESVSQPTAIVPIDNPAAAAWQMVDGCIDHRRHLRPVNQIGADRVTPTLVNRALPGPLVVNIEQVVLAAVEE